MLGNKLFKPIVAFSLLFFLLLNTGTYAQQALSLEEKVAGALRFQTISYNDTAKTDWRNFDGFQAYLKIQFPRLHALVLPERIGGHSLLYRWEGKHPSLLPIMFNLHQDVVPVANTHGTAWTYPPFDGTIADGYVWGRGALDTKGPLVALMAAIEQLISEGFQPPCDVYIALGQDEEIGGLQGAFNIAKVLSERKIRLAFVLDEGPSVVEDVFDANDPPVALIGLAEKGFANIELTANGVGGHSSIPSFETAIGTMAAALQKIKKHPMPQHLLPLTLEGLEGVAPIMDKKTQFAIKNNRLLKGQILKAMAKEPITDAVTRTKISPTMINGGIKANILPREVTAILNVRLLQGDSLADVLAHLKKVINDKRVDIKAWPSYTEASPITSSKTTQFALLKSSILEVHPSALISPTLMPAGTDSKNFTGLSENLFRFSPFKIPKAEAERIHNNDERIPIAACQEMQQFYKVLIQKLPEKW